MSIKDGGPALPDSLYDGMTLRDYFAAKAMQGTIAKRGINEDRDGQMWAAMYAYEMADAMLKAREEG